MINANEDHPNIKFFIYMDSDAVIDRAFADVPLNRMIKVSAATGGNDSLFHSYILLCSDNARAAEVGARAKAHHLQPGRAVLVVLAGDEGGLYHVLERWVGLT